MFSIVALLAILCSGLGAPQSPRRPQHGRIIGGHEVNIADYPYQVALVYNGKPDCGGSIISESFIITAAHCSTDEDIPIMYVRANSTLSNQGGQLIKVESAYIHPLYDWPAYDFAILKLAEPLHLGVGAQPVDLPDENDTIAVGSPAEASGWGLTEDGDVSLVLKAVEVYVVSDEQCRDIFDFLDPGSFCAGVLEGGKNICGGDSGGPLAANNTLWGVTAFVSINCSAPFPGGYTKITEVRGFIREITGL